MNNTKFSTWIEHMLKSFVFEIIIVNLLPYARFLLLIVLEFWHRLYDQIYPVSTLLHYIARIIFCQHVWDV